LMIVVAIMAIVMAIAIPGYRDYSLRASRAVAKATLLDVANKQEQFFLNSKTYTTNITSLGYGGAFVNSRGQMEAALGTASIYQITVAVGNTGAITSSYNLTATPVKAQVGDTKCNALTLSNAGAKTANGQSTGTTMDTCWGK
jgi:type IV pilus assembly protein PilE